MSGSLQRRCPETTCQFGQSIVALGCPEPAVTRLFQGLLVAFGVKRDKYYDHIGPIGTTRGDIMTQYSDHNVTPNPVPELRCSPGPRTSLSQVSLGQV